MDGPEDITGGCLCGNVRFAVSEPLYDPHYCHCRTCQKASGAPVIAGAFAAREAFRITSGAPKFYQSSPIAERGFCGSCGTYLFYRPLLAEWSEWMVITLASLDRPEDLPPQRHYGTESRVAWFSIHDDLPRETYEEGFVDLLCGPVGPERAAVLARYGVR